MILLDMTVYRKEEKYRSAKKHRSTVLQFFHKDQGELLLNLFQYCSPEFAEACRGQLDFLKACQN